MKLSEKIISDAILHAREKYDARTEKSETQFSV